MCQIHLYWIFKTVTLFPINPILSNIKKKYFALKISTKCFLLSAYITINLPFEYHANAKVTFINIRNPSDYAEIIS